MKRSGGYLDGKDAVITAALNTFFPTVWVVLHPFRDEDISATAKVGLATEVAEARAAYGISE